MSQVEKRTFSGDFKRAAVRRMEAGESSAALSRELAVRRTLLYRWRDISSAGWSEGFSGQAGPAFKNQGADARAWCGRGDGVGPGAA